jgi:hypothetical protein
LAFRGKANARTPEQVRGDGSGEPIVARTKKPANRFAGFLYQ